MEAKKKEKNCENCYYNNVWLFDYPCRDCQIATNDKWRDKNDV